jgi:uncharacterized protein (DUF1800 family)
VDQQKRKGRTAVRGSQPLSGEQQIQNMLAKVTFGPRPGDIELISNIGIAAYLEQQLQPDSIDDSALGKRLSKLPTLMLATPTIAEQYNPPKPVPTPSPSPTPSPQPQQLPAQVAMSQPPQALAVPVPSGQADGQAFKPSPATEATTAEQNRSSMSQPKPPANAQNTPKPAPAKNPQQVVTELQRAALLRAVYSERQLNEVLVNFWENHFNIYSQKDADRLLLTSFDRDVVRPYAMGRFRDLLGATAHSPAMLYYLDNWQSTVARNYPAANGKPARTTGGVNENYARELMELHSLGVDGGYTQKDVQEVARCFTGWTIRKPNDEGLAYFNPAAHDNGEKNVLGQKITAGGGIGDGEKVLDILARHPSTAKFIATKLARRFVSDDPPSSVVERAANVFLKSDGSIRDTLRSIITSPEFMSRNAYRAKTRSPFEYVAAALRALNAETDADRPMLDWISRTGQPIFGRITPDGYPDRADQWLTTGTLLQRLNFANALVTNLIKGTQFDAGRFFTGKNLNNSEEIAALFVHVALGDDITPTVHKTLDGIITVRAPDGRSAGQSVHATPSVRTASATIGAVSPIQISAQSSKSPAAALPAQAVQILTLLIGSPDFQRR